MTFNLDWWNERATLHGQDRVYDTAGFRAGAVTLRDLDLRLAGDVTDRRVVHLQCHTGMDTLSWLRAGAGSVTGVDFSPVAVRKAIELADDLGLSGRASFVVADVREVPGELSGRFDLCYASRGVLCWIDDVDRWMRTAARLLVAGGRLVLIDYHPLLQMVDGVDPLRLDFPYANDRPRRFTGSGSYALPDQPTRHNETVEFGHSLGEVVTAAVRAGLPVDWLGEHFELDSDPWDGRVLRREPDGRYRWRMDGELLPVLYSLRAVRSPVGPGTGSTPTAGEPGLSTTPAAAERDG